MRAGLLVVLVLLALVQSTAMPRVPLLGARPDLIFLGVVAWTVVRGLREGAIGAFVGGMALDLLSPGWLGSHALALLLVVATVGAMVAPLHRANLLFPAAAAFLGTIAYHLLLMVLTGVPWYSEALVRVLLPLGLVHAALMPPVYALCEWLDRRIRPRMRIG